jgi:hypothetical protein
MGGIWSRCGRFVEAKIYFAAFGIETSNPVNSTATVFVRCCYYTPDINNTGIHTIQGRDSSVGIATRYELDGPGIESWWGREFPHTGPGAQPVSYTMGTGSFPGVKRPGRGAEHPIPSNAEVEGRVELYIYPPPPSLSLSGHLWPVLRRTLPSLYLYVQYSNTNRYLAD